MAEIHVGVDHQWFIALSFIAKSKAIKRRKNRGAAREGKVQSRLLGQGQERSIRGEGGRHSKMLGVGLRLPW